MGPEYDEAIAARLADQMHEEIARQVQARLTQERAPAPESRPADPPSPARMSSSYRAGITVMALIMGFMTTAVAVTHHAAAVSIVVWIAVGAICVAINRDRR